MDYFFWIYLVKLVRDLYSDLYGPQKVADERNSPAISGKSRLVKYYSIWPDTWKTNLKKCHHFLVGDTSSFMVHFPASYDGFTYPHLDQIHFP